jgi:hypothetical protein
VSKAFAAKDLQKNQLFAISKQNLQNRTLTAVSAAI